MQQNRIVLDTNCLLASLSREGHFFNVWRGFVEGQYILCYSNDILLEYEEIIAKHSAPHIARNVVQAIINSPFSESCDPHFRFGLITADPDDNKFVDCAIAANATYIVSDDKHFQELNRYEFPHLTLLRLIQFSALLTEQSNK